MKELSIEQRKELAAYIRNELPNDKGINDISNYSIVRLAAGVFHIYVYWKGQTTKGGSRLHKIALDRNIKIAEASLHIMEGLLEEAGSENLFDKIAVPKAPEKW